MPLPIYKQKGETPLEALDRLRQIQPELATEKLSYAGRLDPMAEGVMLVLVGEENKNREAYLGLEKTYHTEILFGLSTDTGDCLGLVETIMAYEGSRNVEDQVKIIEKNIQVALPQFLGKSSQKYPQFSSKVFAQAGGYEQVRDAKDENNEKDFVEISHEVEVFSAELLTVRALSLEDFLSAVQHDIAQIKGDFRQEEILTEYSHLSMDDSRNKNLFFIIAEMRLAVSSGFYVRQFAQDVGTTLTEPPTPALAFSIVREQVGKWQKSDCIA